MFDEIKEIVFVGLAHVGQPLFGHAVIEQIVIADASGASAAIGAFEYLVSQV